MLHGTVEKHSRNLNLVLVIFDNEYGIKICKLTLQIFLIGYSYKRAWHSIKNKQNEVEYAKKQIELQQFIDLYN